MPQSKETNGPAWIMIYVNSQHDDSGVGSFILRKLSTMIKQKENITICSLPRLDLISLEKAQNAAHIIFVDICCGGDHEQNVRWSLVEPELNGWAIGSPSLTPKLFLGLLHLLYDCRPMAWQVSVRERCLESKVLVNPESHQTAEKAAQQILDWLSSTGLPLSEKMPEKELRRGLSLA